MILSGSDVRDNRDRWEQANDWLTTFSNVEGQELPSERMDAFHRWISDDKNRHAFDRVEALLRDRKHCRDRNVASLTERQTDSYDPRISLKQWLKRGPTLQMARRRRVMVGLIGAVAASGVITILLLPGLFPSDGRSGSARSYETKTGEQARLQLQDGTSVFMSAQTALSATFTRSRRSVILGRGEALFEVAHDSARPFVVIAGNGSITAVGTTFDVRKDADRVVVTVTEGTVSVAPQAESVTELGVQPTLHSRTAPHVPAQVTHGQRIAYDENGTVSAVEQTDAAAATAWREGYLQFYGEPLRYVIQAVNRYSKRQIVVDTVAGDLLYTGNVVPTRIDAWVLGLERIFPVKTVEADDTHVLIQSIVQASAP